MSSASDENRFAPPLAHVEDVAQGPGVLAGRWTRLGATLIDAVVAALAFGLIALVSPFNVFRPPVNSSGVWMLVLQNLVIGFILFLLIHGYLIATRGQTCRMVTWRSRYRSERRGRSARNKLNAETRSDGEQVDFRVSGARTLILRLKVRFFAAHHQSPSIS